MTTVLKLSTEAGNRSCILTKYNNGSYEFNSKLKSADEVVDFEPQIYSTLEEALDGLHSHMVMVLEQEEFGAFGDFKDHFATGALCYCGADPIDPKVVRALNQSEHFSVVRRRKSGRDPVCPLKPTAVVPTEFYIENKDDLKPTKFYKYEQRRQNQREAYFAILGLLQ